MLQFASKEAFSQEHSAYTWTNCLHYENKVYSAYWFAREAAIADFYQTQYNYKPLDMMVHNFFYLFWYMQTLYENHSTV